MPYSKDVNLGSFHISSYEFLKILLCSREMVVVAAEERIVAVVAGRVQCQTNAWSTAWLGVKTYVHGQYRHELHLHNANALHKRLLVFRHRLPILVSFLSNFYPQLTLPSLALPPPYLSFSSHSAALQVNRLSVSTEEGNKTRYMRTRVRPKESRGQQ